MHEANNNGLDFRSSRWDDRIDKRSTVIRDSQSPPLLRLVEQANAATSHGLPNTDNSVHRIPSKTRRVSFQSIRIKQYERILGDHPSCSAGAPIAIGWTVLQDEIVDVDEYERQRAPVRRASVARLIVPREERETILSEWGVTNRQIVSSIRKISIVKRQRRRTAQSCCYDGLEEVLEKASRQIKQGIMQSMSLRRSPKFSNDNVSNRYLLPRRLSDKSKETSDSDSASVSKDPTSLSCQGSPSTQDSDPIQNELRQVAHSLSELLLLSPTERLHPSFKKVCLFENECQSPKRMINSEPSLSPSSNKEMAELCSRTSLLLEGVDGEIGTEASFPRSSIVGSCEWDGTESSMTSVVECDFFDSENFSESSL